MGYFIVMKAHSIKHFPNIEYKKHKTEIVCQIFIFFKILQQKCIIFGFLDYIRGR